MAPLVISHRIVNGFSKTMQGDESTQLRDSEVKGSLLIVICHFLLVSKNKTCLSVPSDIYRSPEIRLVAFVCMIRTIILHYFLVAVLTPGFVNTMTLNRSRTSKNNTSSFCRNLNNHHHVTYAQGNYRVRK